MASLLNVHFVSRSPCFINYSWPLWWTRIQAPVSLGIGMKLFNHWRWKWSRCIKSAGICVAYVIQKCKQGSWRGFCFWFVGARGEGFNMCRGHNVSVECQLQVVPVRTMGRKSWVVGWGENLPVTPVWQFHAACGLQMCWQFDSWQVVGSLQSTTYTLHPLQVMLWLAECLIANHLNIPFIHTPLPKKVFYCIW